MNNALYRFICGFIKPEDDVVIDIGCGNGDGTLLLSRYAKKVVGIDKDRLSVIDASNTKKRDNNYFFIGNLDQMDTFPDCDVCVMINVLQDLRYPRSSLAKIKQSTKRFVYVVIEEGTYNPDELMGCFNTWRYFGDIRVDNSLLFIFEKI